VLERVHVGRHPAEDRPLELLLGARLGARHHQRRLGFRDRLRCERQLTSPRAVFVEEVLPKHLFVNGIVLMAADQRGPPGPIQVDQIGRVERRHRREVGEHVAGADRQPGRPQLAPESDEHAAERVARLRPGRVSHRR
jgi:hypothetical protein